MLRSVIFTVQLTVKWQSKHSSNNSSIIRRVTDDAVAAKLEEEEEKLTDILRRSLSRYISPTMWGSTNLIRTSALSWAELHSNNLGL